MAILRQHEKFSTEVAHTTTVGKVITVRGQDASVDDGGESPLWFTCTTTGKPNFEPGDFVAVARSDKAADIDIRDSRVGDADTANKVTKPCWRARRNGIEWTLCTQREFGTGGQDADDVLVFSPGLHVEPPHEDELSGTIVATVSRPDSWISSPMMVIPGWAIEDDPP